MTGLPRRHLYHADAMFPLSDVTLEGTMTGTLEEANEMMALARAGKIPPVPIIERELGRAGLAR